MNTNIEKFLERFKTDYHDMLQDFAMNFSEEKYKLILKLRAPQPFTNDEWDIITTKYRNDVEMARVLLTTPFVYSQMKSQVVDDFLDEVLKVDLYSLKTYFIEDILLHHKHISETQVDDLYYKEHKRMAHTLAEFGFDNGINPKVAKQMLQLELYILGDRLPEPTHFHPEYDIFSQINSDELLECVLENMPKDLGIAEKIATALINSNYISNENKNKIFEQYGCDCHELKLSTPEMIEQLYMSIIETAIPENKAIVEKNRGEFLLMCRARSFLERAIENRMLPEALEYDLVNRLVEDGKKNKSRKMDGLIGLLISKSKSPRVLHLIFKTAIHANDRDEACKNPHISNEDMQEQTDNYCQKIKKNLEKGVDVPEKWLEVVSDMSTRTILKEENYEVMLKTYQPSVYDALITSLKTPEDILKKAKEHVDMKVNDGKQRWRSSQIKAHTRDVLSEYGLLNEENFKYVNSTVHALISQYDRSNKMRNMMIATDFFRKHQDVGEQIEEMCITVAKRLNFKIGTNQDVIDEIKDYFQYKKRDLIMKDWENEPPQYMTRMQIKRAKNSLTHEFSKLLQSDVGKAYGDLEKMAKRYVELDDEEQKREVKEQEHGK